MHVAQVPILLLVLYFVYALFELILLSFDYCGVCPFMGIDTCTCE